MIYSFRNKFAGARAADDKAIYHSKLLIYYISYIFIHNMLDISLLYVRRSLRDKKAESGNAYQKNSPIFGFPAKLTAMQETLEELK